MDKQETKQEIENLIEWVHSAQENINVMPKIGIFWHILLGVCFIASWWLQHFNMDQVFSQPILWAILISFGWAVTFLWYRRFKEDFTNFSTPSKQFSIFWIIQGLLLSIIGFGSVVDITVFQVYPFIFGILMASLSLTTSLIFNLPKLKMIVALWSLSGLFSLFLEDFTQRFLVIGLVCFFVPVGTLVLQKK